MKAALALFLAGLAMLVYATTLPAYTDEKAFQHRHGEMKAGDSAAFYALRDEMITPKYKLQDYGVSALLLSGALALRRRIWRMTTPRPTLPFIAAALLAPTLATAAFVFDLFQGQARGEIPHWADSLGIPLMGLPVLFVVALTWSFAHLTFLAGVRRSVVPLRSAFSRSSNIWLLLVTAVTLALIVLLLAEGAFWYALPCVVWLYLYVALAAARRPHDA
jgi:hypothetical protein